MVLRFLTNTITINKYTWSVEKNMVVCEYYHMKYCTILSTKSSKTKKSKQKANIFRKTSIYMYNMYKCMHIVVIILILNYSIRLSETVPLNSSLGNTNNNHRP